VGKVGADDFGGATRAQGESKVAGAAAQVEDDSVFALKNGAEEFGGAGAPEAVDIDGKDVVEGIVSGGDVGEHRADFLRGVGFGESAFGAGAGGGRVRWVRGHDWHGRSGEWRVTSGEKNRHMREGVRNWRSWHEG